MILRKKRYAVVMKHEGISIEEIEPRHGLTYRQATRLKEQHQAWLAGDGK